MLYPPNQPLNVLPSDVRQLIVSWMPHLIGSSSQQDACHISFQNGFAAPVTLLWIPAMGKTKQLATIPAPPGENWDRCFSMKEKTILVGDWNHGMWIDFPY